MRTHIRMHVDRKSGDINEENYISCILDDDSTEIPPVGANKTPSPNAVDNAKSMKSSKPLEEEAVKVEKNLAIEKR